jgi:hypothetical protein
MDPGAHVWGLTDALLWAADQAQQQAVGTINREAGSHKEAGLWVAQVIRHHHPYTGDLITNDPARKAWIKQVAATAGALFAAVAERMSRHFDVSKPAPTPAPAPAPETTPEPSPAPVKASDDPDAVAKWRHLVDSIGMTAHINALRPILADTFGAPNGLLTEIDAPTFHTQIAHWQADTDQFRAASRQAYEAANLKKAS